MPATQTRPRKQKPAAAPTPAPARVREADATIDLNRIKPSSTNPRQTFDRIDELAASIKLHGLIQPIIVRPTYRSTTGAHISEEAFWISAMRQDLEPLSATYQIVCGERRWKAAAAAGLQKIRCIIRDYTDLQTIQAQLKENHDRQDVHPLEELLGFEAMLALGQDVKSIAATTGYNERHVARRLALAALHPDAADLLRTGKLTIGHADLIARLNTQAQVRAVSFVENQIRNHYLHTAPSLETLRDFIENDLMRELKEAPWKLDDATLTPAGACTTCPHNTANNRQLFDDVAQTTPVCTAADCYQEKQTAFVKLRIAAAAEKTKAEPILLTTWGMKPAAARKTFGQEAQPSYEFVQITAKEAKTLAPDQVTTAIVVDGPTAGELRHIRLDKARDAAAARLKREDAARRKKQIEAGKLTQALIAACGKAAQKQAQDMFAQHHAILVSSDQIRLLLEIAWDRLGANEKNRICAERAWTSTKRDYGWQDKAAAAGMAKLHGYEAFGLLVRCMLIKDAALSPCDNSPIMKRVIRAAEAFEVDIAAVKQAQAEQKPATKNTAKR